VPLGYHTGPSPLPGIQSTQIPRPITRAARMLAEGNEYLGRIITGLPTP
jgi:hypothetical protein